MSISMSIRYLFSERDAGACAQYRETGLMGSVFWGAAFLFCASNVKFAAD
jgi:hypothetical protein